MNLPALLTLLRPPNVFTAFADSLAGLLVLVALGVTLPPGAGAVLLASGCLYLAGIVLNDVFDREVDAKERPTRPIPSGAVPVRMATAIGVGLLVGGVLVASSVGRGPMIVSAVLAGCILLYDGGLKSTKIGPVVMGSCRGLDVTLGLSAGLPLGGDWPAIAIAGPLVLAAYVAGLTYIARDEVDGNTTRRARTGLTFLAIVAVAVVVGLLAHPRLPASPWAWPMARPCARSPAARSGRSRSRSSRCPRSRSSGTSRRREPWDLPDRARSASATTPTGSRTIACPMRSR